MAIPSHGNYSTVDRTAYQYEEDYSDVWEEMKDKAGRLVLLDLITESRPLRNPTYYWMEDISKVRRVLISAQQLSGDTHVDITGTEYTYLQNGDMLVATAEGKTEWMQVNADPSSTVVSVTRGIGDTSAEQHEAGEYLNIVRSVPEGSEADEPEYKGTVRRENYTGIISHTIQLSDSAMQGKPRGYAQAELDRQEAEILLSLKGELEDLILFGPGEARASGAHGQMRGIRGTIVTRAGSNYNTTACTWSYDLINQRMNWLAEEGMVTDRSDLVLFCNSTMYSAAGFWGASAVTRERNDRTFGFEINMFHSTLGLDVPMIWGYAAKPGEFMILDLSRIDMAPLGNRKLKRYIKPAGIVLNDYEARRLVMEWGSKTRFADKAHYLQTAVTVP